ncbi:LPS assembly protein LptD [Aliiroseovarius sp. F20344]|uniref:LPS-assembly protein LptD n=1 Tax=Aliiroseovarius sp. F20344 TaxID=2926414 RepID=UPI001FF18579|nr:LPS assembly protein LptD [Aliiroseovarius sp. F20344]MCK0143485.1 LPS assembly protein LptD [Aliiroseovarius sp. F20344]
MTRLSKHLRAGRLALALLACTGATLALPVSSATAQTASLIADHVRVVGNGGLVAEGNVVVLFGGSRLTATRVSYDKATDTLNITGPITITRPDGTILVAEEAQLSADLRNGILTSARLVLDEQLQIAAAQINRVQDRYTQLSRVVASSCHVCKKNPVPLWQIRADRVVHDEAEQQLYFHGAQLRVADVPIFYLPRLRLPDPTLKRATGFLPPKIRTNSTLGFGLATPYFLKLGDHADLTVSPFVADKTRTLELKYRQAFRSGDLFVEGAISRDSILKDKTRFYVFGEGEFQLPRDFVLSFQLQEVSDPGYLLDYGYSDQDRLRNAITVIRARRDEFAFAGITRYDTLRASELPISDQLPFAQIDAFYERRFHPGGFVGGELRTNLSWQAHFRESELDILGRDVARMGAGLEWRRDWMGPAGLLIEGQAALDADIYWIEQDSRYQTEQSFATPSAGLTLRWPLSRVSRSGAVDILEPVAALAWSEQVGANIPNEDSQFVEFDQGNLFDLNRFPGSDRREEGLRAALGLSWTRSSPSGWGFTLAAGRVFRDVDMGQFTDASGLAGQQSDWLLGASVNLGGQFSIQGRALLDDDFGLTKSETRAAWLTDNFQLGAAHIWVIEDTAEQRPTPTHELRLDSAWRVGDFWTISADGSFDVEAKQATRAGFGVEYRNECLSVDLSLSRRFTTSINVEPTTDFGLQFELIGFGSGRGATVNKCRS